MEGRITVKQQEFLRRWIFKQPEVSRDFIYEILIDYFEEKHLEEERDQSDILMADTFPDEYKPYYSALITLEKERMKAIQMFEDKVLGEDV